MTDQDITHTWILKCSSFISQRKDGREILLYLHFHILTARASQIDFLPGDDSLQLFDHEIVYNSLLWCPTVQP